MWMGSFWKNWNCEICKALDVAIIGSNAIVMIFNIRFLQMFKSCVENETFSLFMFKSTFFFIRKCNKLIVKADHSHVQQQQFKLFLLPHCTFNCSLQQFLLHVLLKPYHCVIKFLMAYLQNHGHTHKKAEHFFALSSPPSIFARLWVSGNY